MRGYCIEEYIFASEFRGQGFGTALLQHLSDRLDNNSNTLLFAQIHPKNLASLATAQRLGLTEVGGHVLISL